MAMRTIYDGSIQVSGSDYTHTVEQDGDYVEAAIEDLDERVTTHPVLTFTLDYPFEREYAGEVRAAGGATLRQIVDAIRAAYRAMYSGTTVEDIPNLDNTRVTGAYGEAVHVIDDLVIEGIDLDDATGRLDIAIGS